MEQGRIRTPWEVLGIEQGASENEVKRAFKLKALKLHPDKTGGNEEDAAEYLVCKKARDLLLDPAARSRYERTGGGWDPTTDSDDNPAGNHGPSGEEWGFFPGLWSELMSEWTAALPLFVKCRVKLAEMITGANKYLHIPGPGAVLDIQVPVGAADGYKIVMRTPDLQRPVIVTLVREREPEVERWLSQRKGADLWLQPVDVPLAEVILGEAKVWLPVLNLETGGIIAKGQLVELHHIAKIEGSTLASTRIEGQGMPIPESDGGGRGAMVAQFRIIFPQQCKKWTVEEKTALRSLLRSSDQPQPPSNGK